MAPNTSDSPPRDDTKSTNFIKQIVEEDLRTGATDGRVVTRFPPEPNGYPHIGHAKSICLNFGLAADYGGVCHLRFDDTNPETEDMEYVEAFQRDIRWLGFDWGENLFFTSDYFEQLYDFAEQLIRDGKAYVDSLNEAEIREYRGTVTEPGRESPYRDRSVEENLDLFRKMRDGDFADGKHVLRAKIDMASPNMLMRDPIMYRIRHAHHYRRGDAWCIYPMYDWAHGQSDAIEQITHSVCTLEFEVHRPLYDWFVESLGLEPRPRQYEFARLSLDYTVMSKRKLLRLVEEGYVDGWDDPRMPTLAGLRRRGITPEAIRAFCDLIGVARADSRVDIGMLEYAIRDDLNYRAPRVMCVLRPLKVVFTNYPEDGEEMLDASYWPHDISREGSRPVPFSRALYIERDDFMEEPSKNFFRLAPGREVRLRHAYIIRCDEVIKDAAGEVVELRCTYDPQTRSGGAAAGRRVKGTLHWVSAAHALPVEVRLYDRLFSVPDPENVEEGQTFKDHLNPDSIEVLTDSRIEPSVRHDVPGTRYQFERQGYFVTDSEDSSADALVFNRIITLRDTWAKIAEKSDGNGSSRGKPRRTTPQVAPQVAPQAPPQPKAEPRERPLKPPGLAARMARYIHSYGLPEDEADRLTTDAELADFFEATIAAHPNEQAASNWIVNELLGALKDQPLSDLPFDAAALGALIALVDDKTISRRIAKDVFAEMLENGGNPRTMVDRQGLRQVTDAGALAPVVAKVVAAHPGKVAEYHGGKTGLIGFFVGQVMRETNGKANPKLVKELLEKRLAE